MATSKLARIKSRASNLARENETLQAGLRAAKRAASGVDKEIAIAAGAGGVGGAFLGYRLQTSQNEKYAEDPESVSSFMIGFGSIPSTTIIGAVIAVASVAKLKGTARVAGASFGGGMAGGGYLAGVPEGFAEKK
ncbi:MAG: hypothetical protein IPK72_08780 [Candidatus Eisenbacteria bacterium]|nr:hypothetical protein [Candidatus Eisenbacteria bacterium]